MQHQLVGDLLQGGPLHLWNVFVERIGRAVDGRPFVVMRLDAIEARTFRDIHRTELVRFKLHGGQIENLGHSVRHRQQPLTARQEPGDDGLFASRLIGEKFPGGKIRLGNDVVELPLRRGPGRWRDEEFVAGFPEQGRRHALRLDMQHDAPGQLQSPDRSNRSPLLLGLESSPAAEPRDERALQTLHHHLHLAHSEFSGERRAQRHQQKRHPDPDGNALRTPAPERPARQHRDANGKVERALVGGAGGQQAEREVRPCDVQSGAIRTRIILLALLSQPPGERAPVHPFLFAERLRHGDG